MFLVSSGTPPFWMWALGIIFSTVWIGLLVSQALAFSVQVFGVFWLHGSVLGSLGVIFSSYLYLYWAS
jgi:hypothetical protein